MHKIVLKITSAFILLPAIISSCNFSNKASENWEKAIKCYKDKGQSSTEHFKVFSDTTLTEKNKLDISLEIQKSHSAIYEMISENEKRLYIARKNPARTFKGIPSYSDLYADKMKISDTEIGEFLDRNPTLLVNSIATDSEKREIVKNFIFRTKIKDKIQVDLNDFEPRDKEEIYYTPCPPATTIPDSTGLNLSSDGEKTFNIFINPGLDEAKIVWRNIKNTISNDILEATKVHFVGSKDTNKDANLEATAQCLVSSGEVQWLEVMNKIFEAPIVRQNGSSHEIILAELAKIRVPNEKGYKACLIKESKELSKRNTFKALISSSFKTELKYFAHVFINGKLFVPFEKGKNPYALQKYIDLTK